MGAPLSRPIPQEFHQYFWDTDAEGLDSSRDAGYIAERLLMKGGMDALRWTLKTFPQSLLERTVRFSRQLSPRCGTFWALYFHLDPSSLQCMKKSSLPLPETPWNR
jgi:hypothetical protein